MKHESHGEQVQQGERFEFGKNWQGFLSVLDERRVREAEASLRSNLELESLDGKRVLDAGSGSGLFSLAARRLGAMVHSFDYDPQSVACTRELKRRFFDGDPAWVIERGSVLDLDYMKGLGTFDVVYSWGVLHHTGAMLQALRNVILPVEANGRLYIAIYNDQGGRSRRWRVVKKSYNALPRPLKLPFMVLVWLPFETKSFLLHALRFQLPQYLRSWTEYKKERGMSRWYDIRDWIGGYPFEVAKPEQIFEYYRNAGFALMKLKTCGGGHGCNEYLFVNESGRSS